MALTLSDVLQYQRYRYPLFTDYLAGNTAEEIVMHDLERRAQQLLRDWQALRRSLERVRQNQRVDQFYHAQLDAIDASIAALPEIAQCIAWCPARSPDRESRASVCQSASAPHDLTQTDGPRAGGLEALIRRNRQAEEAWEDLP